MVGWEWSRACTFWKTQKQNKLATYTNKTKQNMKSNETPLLFLRLHFLVIRFSFPLLPVLLKARPSSCSSLESLPAFSAFPNQTHNSSSCPHVCSPPLHLCRIASERFKVEWGVERRNSNLVSLSFGHLSWHRKHKHSHSLYDLLTTDRTSLLTRK